MLARVSSIRSLTAFSTITSFARSSRSHHHSVCVRAVPGAADEATLRRLFGGSKNTHHFDSMFETKSDHDTFVEMIQDPAVVDVTFDAGKPVHVHYRGSDPSIALPSRVLTSGDVRDLWTSLDRHGHHDRAGMAGSTNRWSCLRNFDGDVTGVTLRLSRLAGVHDTLSDSLKGYLAMGNSTILFGPPGSGKTTMLRCIAEYLNDHVAKRVIVVDESGELGGFGDISTGIGGARRVCVHAGTTHDEAIRLAIRNHTPDVIIVDELMSADDVLSAMSAAARGVQLIATCHASSVRDIVHNPLFRDLMGGQQHAAVSDDMAMRAGGKFVSARKTEPAFRGAYDVSASFLYTNLTNTIDSSLSHTVL